MNASIVKKINFANFTSTEKVLDVNGNKWRYMVSGRGERYILAILSNYTGHLVGLPLAEEFRDEFTTISLSVPAVSSFAETAVGIKAILNAEQVEKCNVIGHSNGGVYLQNFIKQYPNNIEKIVFSHSLTSMSQDDVNSINASEVKIYKKMRIILKVLPVSVLTFALGRMVFPKLKLQSGRGDTDKLIALCKADIKKVTKQEFYTKADCMEEFLFHYTFSSEPYAFRPQDILIVDSKNDKIANSMQRKEMLRLCPGANEYHFETGGHVTLVNCTKEYFSILHKFWDK